VSDDKRIRALAGGKAGQADASGIRAARLSAIKSDILENLRQQSFSIYGIASRHGIPVSYVRPLFAAEGTSLTDFILQQRLAAAHDMLRDARFAGRAINAIAFEVGFGGVANFNRAFRRRYVMKPSDMRAKAESKGQS